MLDDRPSRRELVVIGASAGGVETLKRVAGGLPADLKATICVVLHIAPDSPSALAPILDRAGPLPCRPAADGQELEHGQILVAPPNRHLIVDAGCAKLTEEPPDHFHRPSVDVLFCSAALAFGSAVLGVVLSGNGHDGTAGLSAISEAGGAAIIQDPVEALFAGMPASALASVKPDAVVRSDQIARTIAAIVSGTQRGMPSSETDLESGAPVT
jgi:two-component system, chemotaxis family, protein-glutamate methylesterase/glutaminase